ncbi:MAG TPA: 2TM domain-containing protein [Flavisolibacter sp.]
MQAQHTDKQLRELARRRVEFRRHLVVYIVTNSMLWIIWWAAGQGYMWPIWPMAGWGIGLIFHYLFEYRSAKFLSEEEEYRKLKERSEQHMAAP